MDNDKAFSLILSLGLGLIISALMTIHDDLHKFFNIAQTAANSSLSMRMDDQGHLTQVK